MQISKTKLIQEWPWAVTQTPIPGLLVALSVEYKAELSMELAQDMVRKGEF